MKRRDLLKSCLVAPFALLLKGKKEEFSCSSSASGHPSSESSSEPSSSNIIFYKELQFGEPFSGKIVSMCVFQGNLWIATERGVFLIKERA